MADIYIDTVVYILLRHVILYCIMGGTIACQVKTWVHADGFILQLYQLLASRSLLSYLTSLSVLYEIGSVNDRSYLTGVLGGLSELTHVKHLE